MSSFNLAEYFRNSVNVELFNNYYKTFFENGILETPDGQYMFRLQTDYGLAAYMLKKSVLKNIFRNFFIHFFLTRNKIPADLDEIKKILNLSAGEYIDATYEIDDRELASEIEMAVMKSMEYFIGNIHEMFDETMQRYMEEAFLQTIFGSNPSEYLAIDRTQMDIFNEVFKIHRESMKRRINVKDARGNTPEWTPAMKRELLDYYESILPVIRKAKKFYRSVKRQHNWQFLVKTAYPQLSNETIAHLSFRGKTAEPAEIAYQMASSHFNSKSIEYLKKLTQDARQEREKHSG